MQKQFFPSFFLTQSRRAQAIQRRAMARYQPPPPVLIGLIVAVIVLAICLLGGVR